MEITTEMYAELFNAITDAEKKLQEVMELLKEAQKKTEEMYIEK
ncbi:MAG: hypothetical protein Q4B31_03520 [Clostridia bacterium]|nr:hypothetical protein [Clostridia bacterium]MDO4618575.1 hypothetical protein [Clostridia bacterium]